MKLYPPVIDNKLPAFYGNSITIPFELNKTTSMSQVNGAVILIKSVNNNESLMEEKQRIERNITNNTITFSNLSELLKENVSLTPGQFYKIQIAFTDGQGKIGYYSNVGIAKYIHQPFMYIDELEQKNNVLNNTYLYTGCYFTLDKEYNDIYNIFLELQNELFPRILKLSEIIDEQLVNQIKEALETIVQKPLSDINIILYNDLKSILDQIKIIPIDFDLVKQAINQCLSNLKIIENEFFTSLKSYLLPSQEPLYDYIFTLYDSDKVTILDTSGTCLNINEENNDHITINAWQTFKYLKPYTNYYIQFSGTTLNGLKLSSRKYRIQAPDTIDLDINADFIAKLDYENGCIDISLQSDSSFNSMIKYKFLISRASSKDNYSTWEPIMKNIKSFNFGDLDNADPNLEIEGIPNLYIWTDYTIEQGVSYIYALQAYNDYEIFSNRIYSNRIKYTQEEKENNINELKDILVNVINCLSVSEKYYNSEKKPEETLKQDFKKQHSISTMNQMQYILNKYNWEDIYKVLRKKITLVNSDSLIQQSLNIIVENYRNLISLLQKKIDYFESIDIYGDPIPVLANFEHAYLFDGQRQLKLAFNPKVPSFKNTVLESKVDTLGGKYPFFFRNAKVKYKEFPISGLISCLMDPDDKFLTGVNQYQLATHNANGTINILDEHVGNTQLTSTNIYKERNFKMEVLEWLTNGEPKIFRSPTEGNFIIRLMNTSLSPNDTVGRMLHTFSSTAYEMADYTFDNLRKYSFVDIDLSLKEKITYICQTLLTTENDDSNNISFTFPVKYIKFSNTVPGQGDINLLITYKDSERKKISFRGEYVLTVAATENIVTVALDGDNDSVEIIWAYETTPPSNNFNYIQYITLTEESAQFIGGGSQLNGTSRSQGEKQYKDVTSITTQDIIQNCLANNNIEREIGQVNYLRIYRRHIEDCWYRNGQCYTSPVGSVLEKFTYADTLIYRVLKESENYYVWRDCGKYICVPENIFLQSNPYQVTLNGETFTLEANEISSYANKNLMIYLQANKYADNEFYFPITTETTIESTSINEIQQLEVGLGLNVEIEYYVKTFDYYYNTNNSAEEEKNSAFEDLKNSFETGGKEYFNKLSQYTEKYNQYLNNLDAILQELKQSGEEIDTT